MYNDSNIQIIEVQSKYFCPVTVEIEMRVHLVELRV